MAKPICIIYFPENMVAGGSNRGWIYEFMSYLNGEPQRNDRVSFGEQKGYWKDYYWFCFYKEEITEPEIKVFYEKDFTEIQFEELKKLITDSLNEVKIKSNEQNII